jgi:hypothetical protein
MGNAAAIVREIDHMAGGDKGERVPSSRFLSPAARAVSSENPKGVHVNQK